MITAAKLRELKRLARAATQPGPWTTNTDANNHTHVLDADGMWVADVGIDEKDAAFIAAASPDVVLALIAELEKVRA